MTSRPISAALAALRSGTAALHTRLDQHPALAALSMPSPRPEEVGAALALLHGPLAALERQALAGLSALNHPYTFCTRIPALDADLAACRVLPEPCLVTPPVATSIGASTGLLYVLEGARLGAAVIHRRLPRAPSPDGTWRFFSEADGVETWRRFSALLDGRDDLATAPEADFVASARAAFTLFLDHLDRA